MNNPRNDCSSVTLVGASMSVIARRRSFNTCKPSADTRKPKYFTSGSLKWHFSLLCLKPDSDNFCSTVRRLESCCCVDWPVSSISFRYTATPGSSQNRFYISLWKMANAELIPKLNLLQRNNPLRVLIVRYCFASSFKINWLEAWVRSSFEKITPPLSELNRSSGVGRG